MFERISCKTYRLTSALEGTNSYALSQITGDGSTLVEIASGGLFSFATVEFAIAEDGAYILTFGNNNYPFIVYCDIEEGLLTLMKELLCGTPCNEKGHPTIRDKRLYFYNAAMLSFQTFLLMLNEMYYTNPPFQGAITVDTLQRMFCIEKVLKVVTDHLACAGLLDNSDCEPKPCTGC